MVWLKESHPFILGRSRRCYNLDFLVKVMHWKLYKLYEIIMKFVCKLIDDVRAHCYVLRKWIYIYTHTSFEKGQFKIECLCTIKWMNKKDMEWW